MPRKELPKIFSTPRLLTPDVIDALRQLDVHHSYIGEMRFMSGPATSMRAESRVIDFLMCLLCLPEYSEDGGLLFEFSHPSANFVGQTGEDPLDAESDTWNSAVYFRKDRSEWIQGRVCRVRACHDPLINESMVADCLETFPAS